MEIKLLTDDARMPTKATDGSAGYDIYATKNCILSAFGDTMEIHTGVAIWIQDPTICGLVVPRSGFSIRTKSHLWNTVGVIDSDYQGELVLYLAIPECFFVDANDRIAQIIFTTITSPVFTQVINFTSETDRGKGGFGSTGK